MAAETPRSQIEVRRDAANGILNITFNRPDIRNALNSQSFRELRDILEQAESDHDIGVIVLSGSGPAFSSGHDLSENYLDDSLHPDAVPFKSQTDSGQPLITNISNALRQVTDVMLYLWRYPKVTIAQLHGYCLAGGLELAMMADMVTVTNDCILGHPAHRGVGVARNAMVLPMVIGMRKAKELFFTGDTFTGTQAVEWGLANYAWETAEELDAQTQDLARRVASLSSDHLALLKAATNQFYENMGLYSSVYSATRLDAMAQATESSYAWHKSLESLGAKEAIRKRDEPYRRTDSI